ncbi:MAG: site-specific integrase [Ruminococcus sp.]|nr:site-specific integrase [Ruminococcus sp.]
MKNENHKNSSESLSSIPSHKILSFMRSLSSSTIEDENKNIVTINDWLEYWLANFCTNLKKNTFLYYSQTAHIHISRVLGDIKLIDLTNEDIQLFINSLYLGVGIPEPLSPKSIKNVHGILHKALSIAVLHKYIDENPANHIILPKITKSDIRVFSNAELQTFLSAIKNHEKELLFIVALFTGMRQGELIGLTWDCINFEEGSIYLYRQLVKDRETKNYKFTTLKNNKSRKLFPAKLIMKMLYELKKKSFSENNFVFISPRTKSHYTAPAVYNSYKKIVTKIGIPEMRYHDLRHTYAVLSLQAGDDIKTLQNNLGHYSSAFTLDVYAHYTSDMQYISSNKMSDFISANFPELNF